MPVASSDRAPTAAWRDYWDGVVGGEGDDALELLDSKENTELLNERK